MQIQRPAYAFAGPARPMGPVMSISALPSMPQAVSEPIQTPLMVGPFLSNVWNRLKQFFSNMFGEKSEVKAGGGPVLRQGATGDSVRVLQDKLRQHGCDPGASDGIFGPQTLAAVTAFQAKKGLAVDGIVGPQTWAALDGGAAAAPAPSSGGSGPLLRGGSFGEPVKALQARLRDLGIDPGPIDGIFGQRTAEAVMVFQAQRGLDRDGIVGPQTWNALGIHVTGTVSNGNSGSANGMATVQGKQMTPGTAQAFQAMAAEAARAGVNLRINSAYRSDAEQARLFADAVRKYGSESAASKWVAPPGKSNHRTGKALDIDTSSGEHAWLSRNAPRFGFRQPMSWEPWHWEFQG